MCATNLNIAKYLLVVAVFFHAYTSSKAQQYAPIGKFLPDSAKIGEPVQFALSYRHAKNAEVFFPDSTGSFFPFEFISKEFFPTKTTNGISLDSVVYHLRSFEVRASLELSVPVLLVEQGDTIPLYCPADRIITTQYIQTMPDTVVLKQDLTYTAVTKHLNYPYYLFFGFILIVFLVLFYFIFGKIIIRNYRLYKMYTNHILYLRTFEKLNHEMETKPNLHAMEKMVGEWKNYLTKLEQKPINTFTTTEIISLFNKEELKESLQEIDRSIYSGTLTGNPTLAIGVLKKFSNKRYKKRRKELRNAR